MKIWKIQGYRTPEFEWRYELVLIDPEKANESFEGITAACADTMRFDGEIYRARTHWLCGGCHCYCHPAGNAQVWGTWAQCIQYMRQHKISNDRDNRLMIAEVPC